MPQKHLLQNILVMLPIVPFTSATYVSKAWNSLCNRILYPPKLSSMLSLNPSPSMLLTRLCKGFCQRQFDHILLLPIQELDSPFPRLCSLDVVTDEFKEVK